MPPTGRRKGQVVAVEMIVHDKTKKGFKSAQGNLRVLQGQLVGMAGISGFGGVNTAAGALVATLGTLGTVGLRAFATLETSMTRLQVLTATTAGEAARLASEYERIGRATGTDPTQVAGGGFFARSAGLGVAATADFALASAQASRIFGTDPAVLSRTAITGATAFQTQGRGVLDALVGTSRASQFTPQELGAAFPRGFSSAGAAGLSLEEYGGALAAQSQYGANASEAVTRLQQFLESVLNPTAEGRMSLTAAGIDPQELAQAMDSSLTSAVDMLAGKVASGQLDLRKLSGTTGAIAFRDLVSFDEQFTGGLEALFADIADSAGSVADGAKLFEDTVEFKFDAAVQDFKQAAKDLTINLIDFFDIDFPGRGDEPEEDGKSNLEKLRDAAKLGVITGGASFVAGQINKPIHAVGRAIHDVPGNVRDWMAQYMPWQVTAMSAAGGGAMRPVGVGLTAEDRTAQQGQIPPGGFTQEALADPVRWMSDSMMELADGTRVLTEEFKNAAMEMANISWDDAGQRMILEAQIAGIHRAAQARGGYTGGDYIAIRLAEEALGKLPDPNVPEEAGNQVLVRPVFDISGDLDVVERVQQYYDDNGFQRGTPGL